VFDLPGAIETQLTEWMGPPFDSSYNAWLYSVVSWPNVFLALAGGFIVDRVTGIRKGALLFCGLILAGQTVFTVGIQARSYPVAVIGRVLYGLGSESLTVVQNTITVRWFSGPYLALVFGVVLAFARVGSSVNFALTPTLTEESVPFALWTGTATCAFSFLACIGLVALDYANARYVEKPAAWAPAAEPAVDERTGEPVIADLPPVAPAAEEDQVSLKDIAKFPLKAWILFMICVFFYQGVLTFYQVASKIMQETGRKYSQTTASLFLAIPNFVSIGASPLFGLLVDSKGYSLSFLVIASAVLSSCHVMFLGDAYEWFFIHPAAIMTVIGFAYALGAAAMWPLLPHIVRKSLTTTGFGLMTAIQNLGLSVFPLLISYLRDLDGIKGTRAQYGVPIIIFIICVTVSSLFAIWLWVLDKRSDGRLNASASRRQELELLAEAEASGFVSINDSEGPLAN
jgi:MFS family permease